MDAMRCGTPSVTTHIGAEAMHDDLPWGGAIEDSAERFAAAAIALYQDASNWQQQQSQGFVILQQFFNRRDYAADLYQRLLELKKGLHNERRNNFVGQMLLHHQHASTRFMGQWIEAKNRPSN
jgi:hypothetical protein